MLDCKACAVRTTNGLEGLCPTCANERTRVEIHEHQAYGFKCEEDEITAQVNDVVAERKFQKMELIRWMTKHAADLSLDSELDRAKLVSLLLGDFIVVRKDR